MVHAANRRWTLITGASSGIGKALAYQLAENESSNLILVARRKQRLDDLQAELYKLDNPPQIECFSLDLTKNEQIISLVRENLSLFSKVSCLINNAGLAIGKDPFEQNEQSAIETMLATNVGGLMCLTREILPFIIQNGGGDIVNLGSVAGKWTYQGGAVYSATKFAIRGFSEALRQDLIGKNIRIINIEPGMVETEFSLVRFQNQSLASQVYKGMHPLTAEDIAETITWSLSRPRHVNIQELVIYPTHQASPTAIHRVE